MKTAFKSVLLLAVLFVLRPSSSVWAGGSFRIPTSQPSITPMFDLVKDLRTAFSDYSEAKMPLQEREAWANQIAKVCKATKPNAAEQVELYVRACFECTTYLSSMNMGEKRFEQSQTIVAGALPYVDAVPVSLAMDLVTQMSYSLDLDSRPLTPQSEAAYRNTFVEYRLRVWRRIVGEIDPTWKEGDPKNEAFLNISPPDGGPSGVAPDSIKDPEIRQAYEKMLAENSRRMERNNQQIYARRNAETWRKRALSVDIVYLYENRPVNNEDWETLKAYLRVYVSDNDLRQELYTKCRKAAHAGGPD